MSLHAYGTAIDINPMQTPYVSFDENTPGIASYKPSNGTQAGYKVSNKPALLNGVRRNTWIMLIT
ncbi:M15 family metallopeptidase [Endozoicomonas numazuensis]|uniref:M15 family metallopeptidase n=1 Tax=Endozoicomonas numazuensis TaxID=1137799 RepID=UPI0009DD256C